MKKQGSFIVVWFTGFILYLIYVSRITLYDIIIGLVTGFTSALVVSDLLVSKPGKVLSIKRILKGFLFIIYYLFVIEPKCHLNVSAMILGLKKYKPDIVSVPYDYSSEYSIAAAANSITNTPGTVVVDVDEENKIYYVHWLEAYTREPNTIRKVILGSYDEWIKEIFEG